MGSTEALRFLIVWMAGWVHSGQLEVIDFLHEENRVLREQLTGRRLRFTDDQRRRLAAKGKMIDDDYSCRSATTILAGRRARPDGTSDLLVPLGADGHR